MAVQDSSNPSQQEALALLHVRKVKRFYIYLAQYFVVAILLIFNNVETPRYFRAGWVTLCWGSGAALSTKCPSWVPPGRSGMWNGTWDASYSRVVQRAATGNRSRNEPLWRQIGIINARQSLGDAQ